MAVQAKAHTEQRKVHAADAVFFASYSVWMISTIICFSSFFGVVLNRARWDVIVIICLVLLVVSEILSVRQGIRWTKKTLAGFAVCAIVGFSCYLSKDAAEASFLPFLFCARNRDLKTLFKVSIVCLAAVLTFVAIAAHLDVVTDAVADDGIRHRHYLGFRYMLRPAMIVFAITVLVICSEGRDISVRTLAVLLVVNVLSYCLTDARLSFGLGVVAIAVSLVFSRAPKTKRRRWIGICLALSFAIVACISIGMSVTYDPSVPWMAQLNATLGDRLRLQHDALFKNGATILGRYVEMVGGSLKLDGTRNTKPYSAIDSVYVQMVVRYGIVVLVAYIAFMGTACYKQYMQGQTIIAVVLALIAIHASLDSLTFQPWLNPLTFVLAGLMTDGATSSTDVEVANEEKTV